MKTLILIRHAKSSWENNLPDKLRPLLEKGINNTIKIADACSHLLNKSDIIFSSDSVRTRETARIICNTLHLDFTKIEFTEDLYTFEYYHLVKFIKNIDSNLNKIIIFGHNFALTDFINQHSNIELDNLPTTGVVEIVFDCENWSEIKQGKVKFQLFPREL